MNPTLDLLENRVSLRRYAPKPLAEEDRQQILQAAMRAPTAGNMQLYSILEITDKKIKETLAQTCDHQPFIAKAPWVLVFLADARRWRDYYKYCRVPAFAAEQGLFWNRPHWGDLFLGLNDALIAAQNAVIAAESLDIGSCYIGDIMERYEVHRELLGLPHYTFPATMLCFGYYPEGMQRKRQRRLPQESIVFENRYPEWTDEMLAHAYAAEEANLKQPNEYDADNYGQYTYARKTGSEFFHEMRRSLNEALKIWS